MSQPYFERLEDLRKTVSKILVLSEGLSIREILERVTEFRIPTTRHLVAVLARDPKKRFKCKNGIWSVAD